MKLSKQLECIALVLDGLIRDVKEYERILETHKYWDRKRPNATQTGIRERIKVIRSMLLQVSKDI